MTFGVNRRAISAVPSLLPESTTTISSAHRTDSRAASRCAASFSVITVTESRGTGEYYRKGRRQKRAEGKAKFKDRRAKREIPLRPSNFCLGRLSDFCLVPSALLLEPAAADRRDLYQLEVDE